MHCMVLLQNKIEPAFTERQLSVFGITEAEAEKKLLQKRKQRKIRKRWVINARLFLRQFRSPLVLLLVFAVVLSAILGECSDMLSELALLLITGVLGLVQERNAGRAGQA